MSESDLGYTFKVMLDQGSIERLAAQISQMLKEIGLTGKRTAADMSHNFTQAAKTSAKAMSGLSDNIHEVTDDVTRMEHAWLTGMSQVQAQFVELTRVMVDMGQSQKTIAANVRSSGSIMRQEAIGTRETQAAASRRAVAEIRAEGNMRVVEAQNAGVAAKEAAKMRIVLTQQMFAQISRIERALGAVIAGTAKTAVAAISRTFSGVGSALSRIFSRSSTSMRQLDKQMSAGVGGSLRQRENLMRSSFTRQEQIISRSAMRQQAALTGLRTSTQTGVVGAANRSLNIGAWVGGAALLMAVKSTFTIGSEFTRGMAVLQAQLNLTDEAMKDVHDTAIQLGNDITLPGVSALDAAESIQMLSKQFAALGDEAVVAAQDAAKGTLQLARAAGVGAEEAAQIVGSAVNVFGIAASEATAVADQVTAAMKNAAGVSFGDFSDAFKQAAAVFAQFQVPAVGATEALVQFDTALAVIARQGVVGSDAGTSLKQFFLQANRNVDATKNALLELTQRAGETGTAFYDAAGKARPLEQTLDILRKGLVGYTDQQRNAALQTIFGSDAIRVANALLGTSSEEYAKVVQAMREQGLAAKIAAAQNTGLKGALDALKSIIQTVQILLYEKLSPVLGDIVLQIAELTNAVLFGTGAWETLRTALIGAALGMTAIIAAKAAVEVVKMLGTAAKLALTPFGALLVTAGLLGAAFALLAKNSEPFRAALQRIGKALEPFVEAVKGAVTRAFTALGRLVTDVVVPALVDAATWLFDHILPAFQAVRKFITDKFIPAVKDLADTLTGVLGGALEWVVEKAKGLWHSIEGFLRPTIDAVHELANAIGAFFTGGASNIGEAVGGLVKGIASTLNLIWDTIFEKLRGVFNKVWGFLKDFFSAKNLKKLAIGFLVIVEEFGRILGLIVSDPRVYKVLAAVAAAAATIAVAFVTGFARGVIENLPELWDMIAGAFKAAIRLAFDNIGLVILGVIGLSLAKRMFVNIGSMFTKAGSVAGDGFVAGFRKSAAASRDFMSTLFSGTKITGQTSMLATASKQAQALQNQLRLMGSSTTVALTPRSIAAAKSEVGKLRKDISDAGYAALKLRDNFRLGVQAVGQVGDAVRGVGGSIVGAGRQFREAFNLQRALRGPGGVDPFRPLLQQAHAAFNGIRDAARPAFTPITEGWKQIGASARSGWTMARVIGSETMDKMRREASTAFGGVAAGMKQIGASARSGWTMARVVMSETLDKMKGSKIAQFGAAAGSSFTAAFSSGFQGIKTSFATMMEGLRTTASQLGTSVGKMVGSALAKGAIGAAAAVGGFVAGKAEGAAGGSGLLSAILGGVGTGAMIGGGFGAAVGAITAGTALVGAAFGRAERSAKLFKQRIDEIKNAVGTQLVDAMKAGELSVLDLKHAFELTGQFSLQDELFNLLKPETRMKLEDLGISMADVTAAFQQGPEAVRALVGEILAAGGQAGITLDNVGTSTSKTASDVATVFAGIQAELEQLASDRNFAPGQFGPARALEETAVALGNVRDGIGDLSPAWQAAADANKKALEASKERVDRYTDALDGANRALESLFSFSFANPMEEVANNAVIAAEGGGTAMAEAMAKGTKVGIAQAENYLNDFGDSVYEVINAGVTDGLIATPADAMRATDAIRQTFLDGLDPADPAQKAIIDQINAAYGSAISNLQPTLDTIHIAEEALAMEDQIQQFLTDHPFSTEIRARVSVSVRDQIQQQFDTGYTGFNEAKAGQLLKKMDQTDDIVSQFVPVGEDMGEGMIIGLKNVGPKVRAAAWELAMSAKHAAQGALIAFSPSRAFMKLGNYIGDGLALGIDSTAGKVADSARAAAQGAIDAARGVGSVDMSVGGRFGGVSPADYVAQQGQAASAPSAQQGMASTDIVKLARAIAAESKPNVNIDQTFNEKVDSRAVASDVAWRLT